MKKMYLWILFVIIGLILFLVILSIISREKPSLGLVDGRLRSCSNRLNCVCSEYEDLPSYIKPLSFSGTVRSNWERAKQIILEMEGKIKLEDDDYLWATFNTKIFRFVDDLELRLDKENNVIHVRSGSRVGYSDMGANRRRIEDLRSRLRKDQSTNDS